MLTAADRKNTFLHPDSESWTQKHNNYKCYKFIHHQLYKSSPLYIAILITKNLGDKYRIYLAFSQPTGVIKLLATKWLKKAYWVLFCSSYFFKQKQMKQYWYFSRNVDFNTYESFQLWLKCIIKCPSCLFSVLAVESHQLSSQRGPFNAAWATPDLFEKPSCQANQGSLMALSP